MSDSPLLSVHAIDHVAVIARDLEASRHFYEEILGMKPVPRPDFPFPGLWFQAGDTQIHVILRERGGGDRRASPVSQGRCLPVVITWPLNSTTARLRPINSRPPACPSQRAPSAGLTDSGRSTSTTPTATWSNCFPRHRCGNATELVTFRISPETACPSILENYSADEPIECAPTLPG